jgi:basic membrane lipoprotein Med (substrate-binding protein (PBP1-ABC) superfamily)
MKPLNKQEENKEKELNQQDEKKYRVPERKTKKKTSGKNVRIDEEYYDLIRTISFNEERTMKDIADSILKEYFDNR